jgi:hypothetical protein
MNIDQLKSMLQDMSPPPFERVGVYLYREDGRYSGAQWIDERAEFSKLLPDISRHIGEGKEVRITDAADNMLFHAKDRSIHWDGMGLDEVRRSVQDKAPTTGTQVHLYREVWPPTGYAGQVRLPAELSHRTGEAMRSQWDTASCLSNRLGERSSIPRFFSCGLWQFRDCVPNRSQVMECRP